MQQRHFQPELMEAIEAKVNKLVDSCFICEEQNPDWVTNIVSVHKKNAKIWIDFQDLNLSALNMNFRCQLLIS